MDISLTPQQGQDAEGVLPGENWFFYWRTSAALWESKMAQLPAGPVFVPLYWGFHTENGDTFDFGGMRPEADLARLCRAAAQLGRELVFLLPVTPVPFQPNGGLPSFLARGPVQDAHGMTMAFLDHEGTVHKPHSLYDPRVYQAFRKYVWQLGEQLQGSQRPAEVRGLTAVWAEGPRVRSGMHDFSGAFHQGLTRYLKQQNLPVKLDENGAEVPGLSAAELPPHEARYRKLITDLYAQTARETLGQLWAGQDDWGFLGGAPTDVFPRSCEAWPWREALFQDLSTLIEWDVLPSSALFSPSEKHGVLQRYLTDSLTPAFLQERLGRRLEDDPELGSFLPLVFWEFHWAEEERDAGPAVLEAQGILPYARRDFPGCWRWRTRLDPGEADGDATEIPLKVFFARGMDLAGLQRVLRLFLHGRRVILDRAGLAPELEKKLHVFMGENDLRPQAVNFLTPVTLVKLGEGVLVLYDGERLATHPVPAKTGFWEHLAKYLRLRHLGVRGDPLPFHTWRTRATTGHEMNYQEVRRLSLYNPGEVRLRCQVPGSKSFAFLKVVDPHAAQVRSTPLGVEVELMPGGAVSLDFGHFGE